MGLGMVTTVPHAGKPTTCEVCRVSCYAGCITGSRDGPVQGALEQLDNAAYSGHVFHPTSPAEP